MNSVVLTGNLVKEVKLEQTKNKKPFLRNTLAVHDGYKTEYEKTYFINFETYSKETLKAFKNFKKGQLIEIQGKLVVENFKNKEGNWVNITKVVVFKAEEVKFKKKTELPPDEEVPFSWDNLE